MGSADKDQPDLCPLFCVLFLYMTTNTCIHPCVSLAPYSSTSFPSSSHPRTFVLDHPLYSAVHVVPLKD